MSDMQDSHHDNSSITDVLMRPSKATSATVERGDSAEHDEMTLRLLNPHCCRLSEEKHMLHECHTAFECIHQGLLH